MRDRLRSIFVLRVDPDTLQDISEERFAEVQTKWLILMNTLSKNGRVTNFQLEDVASVTKFIGFTQSLAQSNAQLKSNIANLRRSLSPQRNSLRRFGVEFAGPDGKGLPIGSERQARVGLLREIETPQDLGGAPPALSEDPVARGSEAETFEGLSDNPTNRDIVKAGKAAARRALKRDGDG